MFALDQMSRFSILAEDKIDFRAFFRSQIVQSGGLANCILFEVNVLEKHRRAGVFPLDANIAPHIARIEKKCTLGSFRMARATLR